MKQPIYSLYPSFIFIFFSQHPLAIVVGQTNYGETPVSNVMNYAHPDFDDYTLHNDVALIKLKKPVTLNSDNIRPVCPTIGVRGHEKTTYGVVDEEGKLRSETDPLRQPCYVVGWGLTDFYWCKYSTYLMDIKSL